MPQDNAIICLGLVLMLAIQTGLRTYAICCISMFWWEANTIGDYVLFEPQHKISNNVVCATSKGSDQPAHMRSLIRAFAKRLNIL